VGLIDRFTKDEVSAKVWWPFALLFVVLAVASFRLENLAIDERMTEASAWATSVIRDTLEPSAPASDISRPLGESEREALTAALAPVLVEDSVDAVRLWASAGTLLYSSSGQDVVGSQEALNDQQIQAATGDPSASVSVRSDRSLTGARTDPVLLTYAAFSAPSTTVGEVQLDEGAVLADLRSWWMRIRLSLAVGALLTLGLALAAMREPVAPIGAGVKFYPESLPPSFVVVNRDEISLHEKAKQPTPRAKAQDRRVEELETANLALEGELQRALSSLAALRAQKGGASRVIPAAPSPASASLPEAPLAEIEDLGISPPAPTEPVRLHAVPEPEPAAAPASQREPLAEIERPEPEIELLPEPDVVEAADLEPEVLPEPESEPEPVPVRDVVVIPEAEPELEPQPVAAPSGSTDEAVDVLNRLVAPGAGSAPSVDPSEIRAKLARTAALKKPGSRERREEQERRTRSDPDTR
jgi:hypothetical protein